MRCREDRNCTGVGAGTRGGPDPTEQLADMNKSAGLSWLLLGTRGTRRSPQHGRQSLGVAQDLSEARSRVTGRWIPADIACQTQHLLSGVPKRAAHPRGHVPSRGDGSAIDAEDGQEDEDALWFR